MGWMYCGGAKPFVSWCFRDVAQARHGIRSPSPFSISNFPNVHGPLPPVRTPKHFRTSLTLILAAFGQLFLIENDCFHRFFEGFCWGVNCQQAFDFPMRILNWRLRIALHAWIEDAYLICYSGILMISDKRSRNRKFKL